MLELFAHCLIRGYINSRVFPFFQLNVNPEYVIPELSFDNNAAVCDMNYSGYDVKLTNCRLSHG